MSVRISGGGSVAETDPIVKAINGIVKSNGTTISAAVVNVDYQGVLTNSAGLASALNDETGTGLSVFNTSPRLSTSILDSNGNTILGLTATGSAAEYLTLANAASAGTPTLSSTGGDTNIDLGLTPKGTGGVSITSTSTGPSTIARGLTVNNGANNGSGDGFIAKGAAVNLIQTDPSTDTVSKMGKITNYTGIATNGLGVPAIYKIGRSTAQTAANASVVTFTPTSDGSFLISANVLVTTSTVHNFTVTVTYTDEGNTSRTSTVPFSVLAGTFITSITNAQGAVPYEGLPLHIRVKASTAITIATTGTFTTVTYNVEGSIIQIA